MVSAAIRILPPIQIDCTLRRDYRIAPDRGTAGTRRKFFMAKMDPGRFAYFDGNIVPIEDAKISILTHAFNYGTGLFEGIRGYYSASDGKVLIFRLKEHIDRLVRNCNVMCMEIKETPADLERICCELVKKNGFKEDVYLRPIIYKSEHSLGPKL